MFSLRTASLVALATLLAGCSAASTPGAMPPEPLPADSPAVATQSEAALLGVYEVAVDLATLEAEFTPLRPRQGALTFGEQFGGVNLTPFLISDPCATCVRLDRIVLDPINDLITIDFGVRHPFRAFPDFPRADLDGFDVRGIVLLPEPTQAHPEFTTEVAPGVPARGDVFTLKNADGYTGVLRNLWTDNTFINPAFPEEQSTLNPFIGYLFDGSQYRFRQGMAFEIQPYTFDVSRTLGELRFFLAISCNYGTPVRAIADRPAPQYLVPWFNQKEAFNVSTGGVFGSIMDWKNPSSASLVEVHASDHQRSLPAKGAEVAWDDPLDTIAFASDVERVEIEIPGVSSGAPSSNSPTAGTGSSLDPYRFEVSVSNAQSASFGTYPVLAKVIDEYSAAPPAFAVGKFEIPYIDDFERAGEDPITDTGWSVSAPLPPATGPGWSMFISGGGNGKYWDDNNNLPYEDNELLYLNTPVFDLTYSSGQPVIEIAHAFLTQAQYDGCAAYLSTNGGFSFDYSAPIEVLTGQDYTQDMFPANKPLDIMAYQTVFTGDSAGRVITQFNLEAAAGKRAVVVQFVFSTDGIVDGTGLGPNGGWSIYECKLYP